MTLLRAVTFSGPDVQTPIDELVALQTRYPVMEVGVLWSLTSAGKPRYVDRDWVETASEAGLRFSLHLCGKVARDLVVNGVAPEIPGRPDRLQVNCNGMSSGLNWWRLVEIPLVIQVCDHMGAFWTGLSAVDGRGPPTCPLFDKSGGKGIRETEWPRPLPIPIPMCGYAGGIGPDNVVETVDALCKFGRMFWIDMEGRIRTPDDRFDLEAVRSVLEKVDGVAYRLVKGETA